MKVLLWSRELNRKSASLATHSNIRKFWNWWIMHLTVLINAKSMIITWLRI